MNVYIGGAKGDYSAMRGPAPKGFHVPTREEFIGIKSIMTQLNIVTGGEWSNYLHLPLSGFRYYENGNVLFQGGGYYRLSTPRTQASTLSSYLMQLDQNSEVGIYYFNYSSCGMHVRAFKDTYVAPNSSWTVIQGTLGSAGIFWNSTEGLISITDGTTGYTIADKNLGATTVYNDGDTLTQANMGNMYQWGNNYGFPSIGSVTTSSTQVNASSYGPGNYYSSSTFITRSSSPYSWDSSNNNNLRGGVTGVIMVPAELKNAYIGEYVPNFATQGPAPDGFHVPLQTEWQGLKTIMSGLSLTTGNDCRINLHIPFAGSRSRISAEAGYQGTVGSYWSSSPYASHNYYAHSLNLGGSSFDTSSPVYRSACFSVRCFKNLFKVPTSSWTVINGTLGSAGIFWDQTDGLISITSDGTTGYTIQDKNLGATTVYNDGDTLTANNCGYFYQWGNNYGFPWTGSVTTSSTTVNASTYGPGNYYSSGTFITRSSSPYDWSNPSNNNLRGGEDGNVPVE